MWRIVMMRCKLREFQLAEKKKVDIPMQKEFDDAANKV